jgi:hypothetical protein
MLHDTIKQSGRSLFVVAAGNDSRDLNDSPEVPAPPRWGQAPNVVVVAASDWNGSILPQIETPEGTRDGSNFGKRFVDLVAPGENIISASAQRRYGPATGTSQAAPQVASAAALLVDRWKVVIDGVLYKSPQLDPGDAKARLIATADWNSGYEGSVWGGRLDFRSAVMFPERNILRTITGEQLGELYTFIPSNDPWVQITNSPFYYERTGNGRRAPRRIRFSRILSLQRQSDGRYRLVLKEPGTNHLKILLDAVLADDQTTLRNRPIRIECSSFEVFDPVTREFAKRDVHDCTHGLSVTQIEEYFLGEAYHIDWEEEL